MSNRLYPDRSEILRGLNVLLEPGQVTELRALEVSTPSYRRQHTVSGYFDNAEALAEAVGNLGTAKGIYLTPNPVNPALLARAVNRARAVDREPLTSDPDIVARRWLLIDLDPVRPAGISSSDAEHTAAIDRALEVNDVLREEGWPAAIVGDSGNGGHLLYRVDLPNDDGARDLVKGCLDALAFRFDDPTVAVDPTTHNSSRIWRLYGCVNRKGDDTSDRPHRLSKLLDIPDPIELVPVGLLRALAESVPKTEPVPRAARAYSETRAPFDVEKWIAEHGLDVTGPFTWSGGRKWIFSACPWNNGHRNRSAFILEMSSGAVAAGCHHASCAGNDWHALRDLVEPAWRDRQRTPERSDGELEAAMNAVIQGSATAATATATASPKPTQSLLDPNYKRTDTANAERLVAQHGADLRYCWPWGKWLVWDGTRWTVDAEAEVMRRAKATARSIYREAAVAETDAEAKKLGEWARQSLTGTRLRELITLAQSEPGVPVQPDALDRDPWLLNCANGTLDLRTGQLRAHRHEDLLTKLAPMEYNPAATCPGWLAFLTRIMDGHESLISFLQRAIGYSLTGATFEQCFFILHGSGANGKSTFLAAVRDLLHDYATATPTETLLIKRHDTIPNDLAALRGARFVCASETEDGRRLAESLVKQLTGGEAISARFLRAEWFSFVPSFKVWLGTNHRPQIRGTDNAIWRRVRLIPFTITIPPEEQDRQLSDKLRGELSGILSWAVRGCLEWQKSGLGVPDEVLAATNQYREEMDVLSAFLGDCCIINRAAWVVKGDLYREYVSWCESTGERSETQRSFNSRIKERGFTDGRGGAQMSRRWYGIGLLTDATDATDAKIGINESSPDSRDDMPKNESVESVASVSTPPPEPEPDPEDREVFVL